MDLTKPKKNLYTPRRYRYLPFLLLALFCFGVSVYLFVSMRSDETFHISERFKKAAQSHFMVQHRETQRHYAKLASLSQFYTARKVISREEFKTYVETFAPGLTQLHAMQWIPRVPRAERSVYEVGAREDGLKDFQITERNQQGKLVAAGEREEYYPVYYSEPYEGNEAALGYDMASGETTRHALERARDSGQFVTTMKTLLALQGQTTSPGLISYYPVYRQGASVDTIAQRRQHLDGFFALVHVYGNFARQLFDLLEPLEIDHYFFARLDRGDWFVAFYPSLNMKGHAKTLNAPDLLRDGLHQEMNFKLGEVEFVLIAKPTSDFFAARRSISPWFFLGAGLAFFMSILVYIAVQINRLALTRRYAAAQSIANDKLTEANQELEAFVYTVSHDLRTPLTVIQGYADLLQELYSDRLHGEPLDFVETIMGQVDRMSTLITDLLYLAKIGRLDRPADPVDIQALLAQLQQDINCSFFTMGNELQIGDLPKLRVPETLLMQIFDNLIGNALRYAGKDGGPIEVGGEKDGEHVRLYVRDHGFGIPKEERGRIFDVFFRGTTGKSVAGTGVGLATVKKIARLYGGNAWVEETPGGGATFCVEMEG